ncbi:hypothetical protein JCM3775_003282, partial [Rhodotorula graminis]
AMGPPMGHGGPHGAPHGMQQPQQNGAGAGGPGPQGQAAFAPFPGVSPGGEYAQQQQGVQAQQAQHSYGFM